MSSEFDQSLHDYINDVLKDKYSVQYLENKYGRHVVTQWRSDQNVSLMIYERRRDMAKQDQILNEQWNNLKTKAFDIIAKALNGDLGDDNQLSTAKWILSGERSYAENRAKAIGEKSADSGSTRSTPIIELVRKKTDRAT